MPQAVRRQHRKMPEPARPRTTNKDDARRSRRVQHQRSGRSNGASGSGRPSTYAATRTRHPARLERVVPPLRDTLALGAGGRTPQEKLGARKDAARRGAADSSAGPRTEAHVRVSASRARTAPLPRAVAARQGRRNRLSEQRRQGERAADRGTRPDVEKPTGPVEAKAPSARVSRELDRVQRGLHRARSSARFAGVECQVVRHSAADGPRSVHFPTTPTCFSCLLTPFRRAHGTACHVTAPSRLPNLSAAAVEQIERRTASSSLYTRAKTSPRSADSRRRTRGRTRPHHEGLRGASNAPSTSRAGEDSLRSRPLRPQEATSARCYARLAGTQKTSDRQGGPARAGQDRIRVGRIKRPPRELRDARRRKER